MVPGCKYRICLAWQLHALDESVEPRQASTDAEHALQKHLQSLRLRFRSMPPEGCMLQCFSLSKVRFHQTQQCQDMQDVMEARVCCARAGSSSPPFIVIQLCSLSS